MDRHREHPEAENILAYVISAHSPFSQCDNSRIRGEARRAPKEEKSENGGEETR